jgi:hypothetical protein
MKRRAERRELTVVVEKTTKSEKKEDYPSIQAPEPAVAHSALSPPGTPLYSRAQLIQGRAVIAP